MKFNHNIIFCNKSKMSGQLQTWPNIEWSYKYSVKSGKYNQMWVHKGFQPSWWQKNLTTVWWGGNNRNINTIWKRKIVIYSSTHLRVILFSPFVFRSNINYKKMLTGSPISKTNGGIMESNLSLKSADLDLLLYQRKAVNQNKCY